MQFFSLGVKTHRSQLSRRSSTFWKRKHLQYLLVRCCCTGTKSQDVHQPGRMSAGQSHNFIEHLSVVYCFCFMWSWNWLLDPFDEKNKALLLLSLRNSCFISACMPLLLCWTHFYSTGVGWVYVTHLYLWCADDCSNVIDNKFIFISSLRNEWAAFASANTDVCAPVLKEWTKAISFSFFLIIWVILESTFWTICHVLQIVP